MGDFYYCNIGIYAWYLVLKLNESELFYQPFLQYILHVNVKGVNTLM